MEHQYAAFKKHLFQGRPCIFQQDNEKPHLHTLQSPGCGGRGYGYLTACLQSRPVSNREVWCILKSKMRARRPVLLPTLRLVCRKNGQNYTWNTSSLGVFSPYTSLSVVQRNGNIQSGNALPVQLFLNVLQVWMTGKDVIYKWHEVDQTKHEIFVFILSAMKYKSK